MHVNRRLIKDIVQITCDDSGAVRSPNAMFLPAKHRICPIARPDLCSAINPPGGRSGGWCRSIWEERTPLGCSWRLSADDFMLLRETVDERCCRDEFGVSTFAKAVAAYRPDPRFPGCVARGL